jgi:hypothetical protein
MIAHKTRSYLREETLVFVTETNRAGKYLLIVSKNLSTLCSGTSEFLILGK